MDSMPYTLRQLTLFVAVAHQGSISGAADALQISPAAVSMAMTDLERALGAQLLLRRPARGVTLTPVGASVLGEARELLECAAQLHLHAQDLAQHLTGRLVIGCYSVLAPYYLPTIFERFADVHPALTVDVVEDSLTRLTQLLRAGQCEVALLYDVDLDTDVETERLSTARPSVVLPVAHPLARRQQVDPRLLADEPMIMLNVPPSMQHTRGVLDALGMVPRVVHRSANPEVVRSLVGRGLGWSILVQQPAVETSYDGHGVVMRPIAGDPGAVDIVLARPRNSVRTGRATAFETFCRAQFAPRDDAMLPSVTA